MPIDEDAPLAQETAAGDEPVQLGWVRSYFMKPAHILPRIDVPQDDRKQTLALQTFIRSSGIFWYALWNGCIQGGVTDTR